MDARKNLLDGYREIANEVTDWRRRNNMARNYTPSPTYDRLLAMAQDEPARFEALKLTPAMLIELGLYENAKAAALAVLKEGQSND
jgi:hypothetical protein